MWQTEVNMPKSPQHPSAYEQRVPLVYFIPGSSTMACHQSISGIKETIMPKDATPRVHWSHWCCHHMLTSSSCLGLTHLSLNTALCQVLECLAECASVGHAVPERQILCVWLASLRSSVSSLIPEPVYLLRAIGCSLSFGGTDPWSLGSSAPQLWGHHAPLLCSSLDWDLWLVPSFQNVQSEDSLGA